MFCFICLFVYVNLYVLFGLLVCLFFGFGKTITVSLSVVGVATVVYVTIIIVSFTVGFVIAYIFVITGTSPVVGHVIVVGDRSQLVAIRLVDRMTSWKFTILGNDGRPSILRDRDTLQCGALTIRHNRLFPSMFPQLVFPHSPHKCPNHNQKYKNKCQ